jgi:chromosome segregation ATPase
MGLVLGFPAFGVEPKTSDGGGAIKKAQGLIRQLSQEKTALEAEKAAWLAEKAGLDAKLKSLEAALAKLQPLAAEIERYKAGLESMKAAYESQQGQLGQERRNQQALVDKYNAVIVKANAIYADNQLLVQAVRERETWIEQCSANTQKLRTAALELIDKYRGKSLLQQLGELEPLTGLGQIETETTVEEYKYQLKQLKITPFKAAETHLDKNTAPVNSEASVNNVPVGGEPSADSQENSSVPVDDALARPALKP